MRLAFQVPVKTSLACLRLPGCWLGEPQTTLAFEVPLRTSLVAEEQGQRWSSFADIESTTGFVPRMTIPMNKWCLQSS